MHCIESLLLLLIAAKLHISEDELIKRLKLKDKVALSYFYDHYSSALYGVITKIIKIEELSEEVLQDVFLRCWNRIDEYDASKGRLYTWVLNIARNMAIDKVRSKEYKGIAKTEELTFNVHVKGAAGHEEISSDAIGIKELVDKLPKEQTQIIDWMYFQGYTQSEIADEFNIPLGTVKTRAKAAMAKLREMFK